MDKEIRKVSDLVAVLEDVDQECDIYVRIPELTEADFPISKIVKEYDLIRDSLTRDKIVLICE